VTRYAKALIAAAGAALEAAAEVASHAELLPAAWQPWARLIIAVAVVAGVYQVPNTPPGTDPGPARAGLHRP